MQLIVVTLEFQDREILGFFFTPTMMDAIWRLGIFEHFHESGPVQMSLEGLGLNRSHVVDFFGRFAFVLTLPGTWKGSNHATHWKGVNLFREDFGGTAWSIFKPSGVSAREQPSFGFVSVVEQGFASGHPEKFGVKGASIEGQLVGLQGWDFGGGAHGIDAILRESGTIDLRGRTRTSILDA
jgi:hypothetical protein